VLAMAAGVAADQALFAVNALFSIDPVINALVTDPIVRAYPAPLAALGLAGVGFVLGAVLAVRRERTGARERRLVGALVAYLALAVTAVALLAWISPPPWPADPYSGPDAATVPVLGGEVVALAMALAAALAALVLRAVRVVPPAAPTARVVT